MMGRKEYFGVLTLLVVFLSVVAAGTLVSRDNLNVPHELEELSESSESPIKKRNYGTYFVPQPHPGYIYPQVYQQVVPQLQQEYVQIYSPPQHQQYIHFFPFGPQQQQEYTHMNGPPEYIHILPRGRNCKRRYKGGIPLQPDEWTTHRPTGEQTTVRSVAVDHEADTRSEEASRELDFLSV